MALKDLTRRIASVQLATLVKEVPDPKGWLYELKWDGYRIVAFRSGKGVALVSRRNQDWTAQFAGVASAVRKLRVRECAIDGEVCAIDARGVPSFQLLQNRAGDIVFVAFDLLWLEGRDLRGEPIEARRAALERLVGHRKGTIVLSETLEGDPKALLARACAAGFEGIMAKEKGSRYTGRRERTWLKIKCTLRQEFAVVGYLPLVNDAHAVGGLLLALHGDDGAFHFSGKVGTGFDRRTRVTLAKQLDALRSSVPTAKGAPRFGGLTRWAKPRLVCEVAFTEWTQGGNIRHPSFRGLRKDKRPEDCVRERAQEV